MLVHQKRFCSASHADAIKQFLISKSPKFKLFQRFEILNSWRIQGFPDLVLMEGLKVSPHNDGGAFWQPLIVLENPQAKWSFRGSSQKVRNLAPQVSGTLLVLDIERLHCVTGHCSIPWLALCWNPSRSVPQKTSFDLDAVVYQATESFQKVLAMTEEGKNYDQNQQTYQRRRRISQAPQ
jgi:hypothetical protein